MLVLFYRNTFLLIRTDINLFSGQTFFAHYKEPYTLPPFSLGLVASLKFEGLARTFQSNRIVLQALLRPGSFADSVG